jgi:L-idonate 5-dehydrogenase
MRRLVLAGPGSVEVREAPTPEPGPGEALVRVRWCGICGSDLVLFREADAEVVHWGHEVVGVVEGGDEALAGRAVAVATTRPCGACADCAAGRPERCTAWTRHQFNGFASHAVLPCRLLTPLPEPIRPAHVLTEPLYVAMDLVERSGLRAGESALIVGAGPIGLLALHCLRRRGIADVRVVGSERSQARRRLAERWGAAVVPADAVGRASVHAAIVTAPYGAIPAGAAAVRYGGRVVYNGLTSRSTVPLDLRDLHVRRIELVPSFPHPQTGFGAAIAAIEADPATLEEVISHRVPLADGSAAFHLLAHVPRDALKVAIEP